MTIFKYLAFSTLFAISVSGTSTHAEWRSLTQAEYQALFKEDMPLAVQGDAKAQAQIGMLYEYGYGVAQDYVEAMKWYRLSAMQGNHDGQFGLGFIYEYGRGVMQDYVRAHMWFNIALAGESRDVIAEKMTIEDVSKAQAMATICVNSGYEDCGW